MSGPLITDASTPLGRLFERMRGWRIPGSLWITVALLIIGAAFAIVKPAAFPTAFNLTNIAISASIILVVAVGQTFVIGTAGIDLSVGSVLVFSSVVSGWLMLALTEALGSESPWMPFAVAAGLGAAALTGAAWGALNGFLIAVARIPAMIVTLGTLGMAMGLAQIITSGNDLRGMPTALTRTVGSGRLFDAIPWMVIIAVLVALIGGLALTYTRFGRYTLAIGSDEEAARRNGIPVRRHLITVYLVGGLLAGIAGWLSLARFGGTTINGYPSANLDSIAGVVLGGTSLFGGVATMVGTAVGVLIPAVLQNGFTISGVEPFWQNVAVGAVLIAAVYFDQRRRRNQILR